MKFLTSDGKEINVTFKVASQKTIAAVRRILSRLKESDVKQNSQVKALENFAPVIREYLPDTDTPGADLGSEFSTAIRRAFKDGKLNITEALQIGRAEDSTEEDLAMAEQNDAVLVDVFAAIIEDKDNTTEEKNLLRDRNWLSEQPFTQMEEAVTDFLRSAKISSKG